MMKDSHLIVELAVIVILLFSAVFSERKPDFGVITACVNKNQSLTVDCSYPFCDNNPPFKCSLYESEKDKGTLIASSYKEMVNNDVSFHNVSNVCRFIIKDHAKIYHNQTKTYICALSRRTSKENKTLTVKYTEKDKLKTCRSGSLLHVSKSLWLIPFIFFQETYF